MTTGKTHLGAAWWAQAIVFSAILIPASFAFDAAAQAPAVEASQAQIKTLLDQAHTEEVGGHLNLAAKIWQQVLAADSDNVEALDGLVRAAKAKDNLPLASIYTDRLDHLRSVNSQAAAKPAVPAAFEAGAKLEPAIKVVPVTKVEAAAAKVEPASIIEASALPKPSVSVQAAVNAKPSSPVEAASKAKPSGVVQASAEPKPSGMVQASEHAAAADKVEVASRVEPSRVERGHVEESHVESSRVEPDHVAAESVRVPSSAEFAGNLDLLRAGTLARQGQYAEAMVVYRELFGNAPPPGDAALAYYETESTLPNSRPHAIAGLRRLAEIYPSDERYPLAISRVLAYTTGGRPELGRPAAAPAIPHAVEAVRQVAPVQPLSPSAPQKGAAQVVAAAPPIHAQGKVPVQSAKGLQPATAASPVAPDGKHPRPLTTETVTAKAFRAKATLARESHEYGAYVPYQPATSAGAPPVGQPAARPGTRPAEVAHPLPASPHTTDAPGSATLSAPRKVNANPAKAAPHASDATTGESKPPADTYNTSDSESVD